MVIVISAISFLLILFVTLSLTGREKKKSPLERLQDLGAYEEAGYEKEIDEGPIKRLSKLLPKSKQSMSTLQKNIIYSDTKYSHEEIVTVKLLSSSAIALLVFAVSKNVIGVAAVFALIWFLPNFYIASKAKRRIEEFNAQLADGLLIISNALKAGYSFLQAISLVSREMDGPFAKEFSVLLKEMSFGITMEESFKNINSRVDSEDLKLIVNAILIQKDVGGNLSEIIDKIIETIRERQRLKAEVKTLTAQGRLSGVIISMLPFTLALFLYFINTEYLMALIKSNVGIGMIIYGLISQTIGFFVIRKITDIEL